MKRKYGPWPASADDVWMLFLIVITGTLLLGAPAFAIYSFHMEAATFNRLTGAHTTWWDAAWVELRVQEAPK